MNSRTKLILSLLTVGLFLGSISLSAMINPEIFTLANKTNKDVKITLHYVKHGVPQKDLIHSENYKDKFKTIKPGKELSVEKNKQFGIPMFKKTFVLTNVLIWDKDQIIKTESRDANKFTQGKTYHIEKNGNKFKIND